MASRSEDPYPEIIESGGREKNTGWVVDINFPICNVTFYQTFL